MDVEGLMCMDACTHRLLNTTGDDKMQTEVKLKKTVHDIRNGIQENIHSQTTKIHNTMQICNCFYKN
jgi:hypothetical protein